MLLQSILLLFTLTGASDNPAIKDFKQRVDRYWDLHKKMESQAPAVAKKKEDPGRIVQHEGARPDGIKAARKGAAEGDIFTPAAQKVFVAVIKQQLSSGKGA